MDGPIVKELIQYIGLGGGGAGAVIGIFLLWVHLRVKVNKDKLDDVKMKCNEFSVTVTKHSVVLAELQTGQKHMCTQQEHITKKLDRLIDIHMKNGVSK